MRKKLFTLFLALMTTMSLMAIGIGDGSSKENAIEYSWEDGAIQWPGTRWHRLDLSPLYDWRGFDTIRLQITNPSNSESVDVTCKMTIMDVEESIAQTLAPSSVYDALEIYCEPLIRERQTELYFIVTSTGRLQLKWQGAYKNGDSCEDATRRRYQEAGTKWHKISAPYQEENWEIDSLVIGFINCDENYDGNAIPNTISISFKTDCDSPAFNSQTFTIEPFGEKDIAFSAELLDPLGWPDLVFSCTSSTTCKYAYHYDGHIPGESCINPIDLNEDPILHPTNMDRWYRIDPLIPEGKDLCIKISNTSNETANYIADFYLDCTGTGLTMTNKIAPYSNDSIIFARELLAGWSSFFIEFESSQASYIWADFINTLNRDTIVTYVTEPYCIGYAYEFDTEVCHFEGTLASDKDTLRFKEFWEVFRDDEQGLHYCDSIVYHTVIPVKNPELIKIENIPADKKLCTAAATAWLVAELNKPHYADPSYAVLDFEKPIVWQKATNDASTEWTDIAEAELTDKDAVVIRYVAKTECGVEIPSDNFVYNLTPTSCTIASGTCGDNLIWTLSCDSVLTISGIGYMDYWSGSSSRPWSSYVSSIKTILISDGVANIGENAFAWCTGLTSVTIGNSVTSIEYSAFFRCTNLSSITIPNSVTHIGNSAFTGCTSLTSIEMPNSVTSIEEGAFDECDGLTSPIYNAHVFVRLPTSYSGAYTIPSGIESIVGSAFSGCSGLTSVTIPNSVTNIGFAAFYECTSLTSIEIPNSVTSIGDFAFTRCYGLTSIDIPNSVTSIGDYAFHGCYPLVSITISSSVTSIGEETFSGCKGLTNVTIPNSVTSIGKLAFAWCTGLTSITSEAVNPPVCGADVFLYVDKSIPLYVPAESVAAYITADQWKEFTNILPNSAEEKEVDVVEVVTTENTASIAWPQIDGVYTYELVIKDQNGNVICTLTFNAEGQLTSIKFGAPAQNGAPQHTQAAGFAFTVTGLNSGTTYDYTIVAKDEAGTVLNTETGSFTTLGGEQAIDHIENTTNAIKFFRDGQILIRKGDKTFDLRGQEVK